MPTFPEKSYIFICRSVFIDAGGMQLKANNLATSSDIELDCILWSELSTCRLSEHNIDTISVHNCSESVNERMVPCFEVRFVLRRQIGYYLLQVSIKIKINRTWRKIFQHTIVKYKRMFWIAQQGYIWDYKATKSEFSVLIYTLINYLVTSRFQSTAKVWPITTSVIPIPIQV